MQIKLKLEKTGPRFFCGSFEQDSYTELYISNIKKAWYHGEIQARKGQEVQKEN